MDSYHITKSAAIDSLMESNLIDEYKGIGYIRPSASSPHDNYFTYLAETTEHYLLATIYKNSMLSRADVLKQIKKEDISLFSPHQWRQYPHDWDYLELVMITSKQDAVKAKIIIECKVYEVNDQDLEYLAFSQDYSSEADITGDRFFYFHIDSKAERFTSKKTLEDICFFNLAWKGFNPERINLGDHIKVEIELYDSNDQLIQTKRVWENIY